MSELLSSRAQQYLSGLNRGPFVSAERLRQLMIEQEIETRTTWLDFQERYAGYSVTLGYDGATWGIVHDQVQHFDNTDPLLIDHDYYDYLDAYVVRCADAHPSFDIMLADNGYYLGRPSESFEIYLEQLSLWHEFVDPRPFCRVRHISNEPDLVTRIESDMLEVVAEASDKHYTYFVGEKILGIKEVETDRWVRAVFADKIAEKEHAEAMAAAEAANKGLMAKLREWWRRGRTTTSD